MVTLLKKNIFIVIIMVTLSGCSKISDYNCKYSEPFEATLTLHFTINEDNNYVPFEIYEGSADKGKLLLKDFTYDSEVTYIVEIPKYYSVKAKYELHDKVFYVIDGGEMTKEEIYINGTTCWDYKDMTLDLRL